MYNILFVGEKVNRRKSNIPFDRRMGCGKFLHEAIYYLENNPWISVDFDNTFKNNRLNKCLLIRQYDYNRVIALGRIAYKELNKLGVNCKYIPHPAFFKRFHSKEGINGYSQLILEEIFNGK